MYERCFGPYVAEFYGNLVKDENGDILKDKSTCTIMIKNRGVKREIIQSFTIGLDAGHGYMAMFQQIGYVPMADVDIIQC